MGLNDLTKGWAEARANLSAEELAAMVEQAQGAELADEQLEGISGGQDIYLGDDLPPGWECPKCKASDYRWHPGGCLFVCNVCGEVF